jgi:hypothetical protein
MNDVVYRPDRGAFHWNVPLAALRAPGSGFLVDGCLRIRVRCGMRAGAAPCIEARACS